MSLDIPGVDLPDMNLSDQPVIGRFFQPIENGLAAVGMGTPVRRFAGIGLASAGLFWLIKPSVFFTSGSGPRPWSLWAGDGADGVAVPWWMASVLIGTAAAVFL